jgi:hypothetical protein
MPPAGVSTATQLPAVMPRAAAVSGCISISGSGARLRRLGTARCWVWQNTDAFAQVSTSGNRLTSSGRATGPERGSTNAGSGE